MLKVSMGRLDEVHIWTLTGLFSLQNKSIRSKATVREAGDGMICSIMDTEACRNSNVTCGEKQEQNS